MNRLEQNWNNLFGEYTTDEVSWWGRWTGYSPNQEVMNSKHAVRSFRSNSDNTMITHTNRYIDEDIEEKIWHIDRETCNQPDGVVHPAMPFMRALSFGAGATAWLTPKFIPGKPFGAEFFFRHNTWRSSSAIIYGANGQLDRIIHIQEHLGCFSDESPSSESSEMSGNRIGQKCSMTPDLSISSEEKVQLSFDQLSRHHKTISLSTGLLLIFPERTNADQPIQMAAGQRTADHKLKYLAAHYTAAAAFTSLISASLQQDI